MKSRFAFVRRHEDTDTLEIEYQRQSRCLNEITVVEPKK